LEGGLNTYGYVGGNPVRWSDQQGLLDPGDWTTTTETTLVGVCARVPLACPAAAVAGAGAAGWGIGSAIYPHISEPLGNVIDKVCKSDKDDCERLYLEIDTLVRLLKKRYWEMRLDKYDLYNTKPTGKMSWAGHQQQFRQLQQTLIKGVSTL